MKLLSTGTAFLFLLLAFAFATSANGASDAGPKPTTRLNIVFCFADDWGRYAHCYADIDKRPTINAAIKTPNIDRIAQDGVLFKNAFVTAPSCTPCRSSLLSGQYFFRTGGGAILMGATWDTHIPSYPLMLRDAGYHIGKSLKVWAPGTPLDAPYGEQKYAYEKDGIAINHFSLYAEKELGKGIPFEKVEATAMEQVGANFDTFLAARKPGQPFCYWFGPVLTHRPFAKGSGVAQWGLDPDAFAGKLPKFMPDVPEVRADYADYVGNILAWDAAVGTIIERLRAAGELDNTLFVVSGDHGMPGVPGGKCNLYDHGTAVALLVRGPGIQGGRVIDDFVNLMDLAPTYLEAGGVEPPSCMTGHSLMPLLRSGKSGQVEAQRDCVVTGRERHVDTARDGNLPYPQRAIRTRDFLYIRNFAPDRWPMGNPRFTGRSDMPPLAKIETETSAAFRDFDASPTKAWLVDQFDNEKWQWHYQYAFGKRPAEELYDLRKDPDEVVNLAADPAYADPKQELAQRMMKILVEAHDPRVSGDGTTFDKAPYAGP